MKKFITYIFTYTIPNIVSAQGYELLVDFPGLPPQPSLISYLLAMFWLLLGSAVVLAVIMIVVGGMQYMTAGLPSSKQEGKQRIVGAVFGLLIAFVAYLILDAINPALLNTGFNLKPMTGGTAGFGGGGNKSATQYYVILAPGGGSTGGCYDSISACMAVVNIDIGESCGGVESCDSVRTQRNRSFSSSNSANQTSQNSQPTWFMSQGGGYSLSPVTTSGGTSNTQPQTGIPAQQGAYSFWSMHPGYGNFNPSPSTPGTTATQPARALPPGTTPGTYAPTTGQAIVLPPGTTPGTIR